MNDEKYRYLIKVGTYYFTMLVFILSYTYYIVFTKLNKLNKLKIIHVDYGVKIYHTHEKI